MRSTLLRLAAVPVLAAVVALGPGAADGGPGRGDGRVVLQARIVGSVSTDPELFGAIPGSNPWSESRSRVTVTSDGWVDLRVRDLINLQYGNNPIFILHASVACNGVVVARTGTVSFDEDGNARLRERVTLPDRCLAPAVLIHPLDRTTSYIAASGAA
ncbi:hypothetical protein ACWFNE_05825 [Cellulomonas sp. NPDC055163]